MPVPASIPTQTSQPFKTGGDDLDDGLELDANLLASDAEDVDSDMDDDDSVTGFLSAEDEDEDKTPASRKRKVVDDDDDESDAAADGADADAERKRRRREKDKARKAGKAAVRLARGDDVPASPTHLSPTELAEILLASARSTFPNSSAMEIDDTVVPVDRIIPSPSYAAVGEGFDPLIMRLEERELLVSHIGVVLSQMPKKLPTATPRAIILSLSGLRCADVVRAVRGLKTGGEVAKLFAKHFKLADQVKYLSKTRVAIAVGTPARVAKLLAQGAIKITPHTVVLLDIGHRDSKTRTLLTLPEVRDELWKSLLSGPSRETLFSGGAHFTAF